MEAPVLLENYLLRDFINLYIGEGDKKTRNKVGIVNTDFAVLKLSYKALRLLSSKRIEVVIRYYKDQNPEELKNYWVNLFGNDNIKYTLAEKDNQTNLAGSNYANKYGLLTLRIFDTYLKCRVNAYMDYLKKTWEQ